MSKYFKKKDLFKKQKSNFLKKPIKMKKRNFKIKFKKFNFIQPNYKFALIINKATVFMFYNKFFFFFTPKVKRYFFLKKCFKYLFKAQTHISKYFFFKIKFFGKTFKWIFTRKKIKFKVQKAHKTFIIFKNWKFKKKKKFKFKIRYFLKKDFLNMKNNLKKIKPINIFTKKGLKLLKYIRYKKKGKISTYM